MRYGFAVTGCSFHRAASTFAGPAVSGLPMCVCSEDDGGGLDRECVLEGYRLASRKALRLQEEEVVDARCHDVDMISRIS